jgi:hypothetical protein
MNTASNQYQNMADFPGMKFLDSEQRPINHANDRADASKILLEMLQREARPDAERMSIIGHYKGLCVSGFFDSKNSSYSLYLSSSFCEAHGMVVPLGSSEKGFITRLDNAVSSIPRVKEEREVALSSLDDMFASAEERIAAGFPKALEYAQKEKRLSEINEQMQMGGKVIAAEKEEQVAMPGMSISTTSAAPMKAKAI